MSLDFRTLRDAFSCFATGVTIVTVKAPNGEPVGITANSFNSVSLDPPLVLFSLGLHARSLKAFLSSAYFAVNVLREEQRELSTRFAVTHPEKWSGIRHVTWSTGCPILPDALANFECQTRYTYDGGDHVIFVGEVLRASTDLHGKPLLFYRGHYRGIGGDH